MDRYEVLHHLGAGSFGNVAVGRDKATNRKVALKFIGKGGKQEAEIKGLKKECDIQKNLHHPNIIQMLDSFETEEAIVVVTELAHGDLYKVVPQYARWHGQAVQKIACDLVSALHFLHSQRILHRDLKPQNILVGIDGKAKLCDFGFARMIAINSFMLTSMKGTPLYMAPEIILEQPYDHSADLWSMGCILYELLVGQPPFHTNSLFVLRKMMEEASVQWHEAIFGDALSFLQGLLEKNPKKRLTWPDLLYHPYVAGKILVDKSVAEFALTKALTSSQEVVKETERQLLQRELEQCSKVYRKAMKKYAQAQKKLKRWNSEAALARGKPLPPKPPQIITPSSKLPELLQNLKIQQGGAPLPPQVTLPPQRQKAVNAGAAPSSEGTTSSSDCETESDSDSDDDGRKTVIQDYSSSSPEKSRQVERTYSSVDIMAEDVSGSGVLFTLDTSGSTEFKIDTDEWLYFLMTTMKEIVENPLNLCQKHFLTMVVAPLKNTSADASVLEKIAVLLSLPFTLNEGFLNEIVPGYISQLQGIYVSTKVLPLLLFACKIIVVNRVNGLTLTLENICEKLTDEDLDGLEKCFRLVTFLVHMDENFVTQFCDSVCVLKLGAILQLFLKLEGNGRKKSVTVDTIAVLCHLLRVFPTNKSIVEDVMLGDKEEITRLLGHEDPVIQGKSIRLLTYLFVTSEKVKKDYLTRRRAKVWNVLSKAVISGDQELQETAKFALKVLSCKTTSGGGGGGTASGVNPLSKTPVNTSKDLNSATTKGSFGSNKSSDNQERVAQPGLISCNNQTLSLSGGEEEEEQQQRSSSNKNLAQNPNSNLACANDASR